MIGNATGINGSPVVARYDGTILIRLPRDQWRYSGGNCVCPTCKETGRAGFWDTLAVSTKPPKGGGFDYAWTCHHPRHWDYDCIEVVSLDVDGTAHIRKSRTVSGPGYWSLVIPWSATPTAWHPTEKTGPFSELSSGSFKTEGDLLTWAQANLAGQPFRVRFNETPAESQATG